MLSLSSSSRSRSVGPRQVHASRPSEKRSLSYACSNESEITIAEAGDPWDGGSSAAVFVESCKAAKSEAAAGCSRQRCGSLALRLGEGDFAEDFVEAGQDFHVHGVGGRRVAIGRRRRAVVTRVTVAARNVRVPRGTGLSRLLHRTGPALTRVPSAHNQHTNRPLT